MPFDVAQRAMSVDVSKLPAYAGVPFPEGYLLLRVSKVIEAEAKDVEPQTAARIAALYGRSQYDAYVGSLRERADEVPRLGESLRSAYDHAKQALAVLSEEEVKALI